MARNRVIGRDNALPWHLPNDFKHFKAVTMGKPMIMGRKTWESLPGLLPGRQHIVITRDENYKAEGASVAHSLQEALESADDSEEVMIIGGANLYGQALEIADRIYLTIIDTDAEGDAHFPEFDSANWKQVSTDEHPSDAKHLWPYRFITLERIDKV